LNLKLEFKLQSFDKITIISNWWAYGKPFEWQETTGPISCCVQTLKEQCFAEYLTSWVESHEIYE